MFEPLLGAGSRIWRSKCKKTTSLPCTAEDHADEEKRAEPFPEAHVRNNYYHAYMQYDHAWQFRTCFVRWFRTNFGDLLQKSMNGSRWVAQCFQLNFSYVLETKDLVTWVCLRLQTQPKLSKMSHLSISNFTFLVSRSRSASKPWDTQAVQNSCGFDL